MTMGISVHRLIKTNAAQGYFVEKARIVLKMKSEKKEKDQTIDTTEHLCQRRWWREGNKQHGQRGAPAYREGALRPKLKNPSFCHGLEIFTIYKGASGNTDLHSNHQWWLKKKKESRTGKTRRGQKKKQGYRDAEHISKGSEAGN